MQAVGLTFATLVALLLAYRSGMIRATEKFKMGIVAATGGIAVFCLIRFSAQGRAIWRREESLVALP